MSDFDNDLSDPGNFDDDNMEDGDQEVENVSSLSGDSEEADVNNESDSHGSETGSESDNQEYQENAAIQTSDIRDKDEDPNKPKITPPFLTKYEKARIIGTRAVQIAQNSPIYVETDDKDYDPIRIAEKEFVQNKIPFIIRRYLPNKEYEDWSLQELEVLE